MRVSKFKKFLALQSKAKAAVSEKVGLALKHFSKHLSTLIAASTALIKHGKNLVSAGNETSSISQSRRLACFATSSCYEGNLKASRMFSNVLVAVEIT